MSPYQMLIVEMFLQKTRAENAEPVIKDFLKKYKLFKLITHAKEREIFRIISKIGLGKRRTKALINASKEITEKYGGEGFPPNEKKLSEFNNVGQYISNAVFCFALDKRLPILDVNTSRVVSRFFNIKNDKDLRHNKRLLKKAEELVPRKNFKEYNWGLLDLGALVCKTKPKCESCPLKGKCSFYNSLGR